jgi:hypothetical protein
MSMLRLITFEMCVTEIPASVSSKHGDPSRRQHSAATMSAQSNLARSDDLSKWCRSVETFEPRFEKWIGYVLRVKDNSCEPEDFIPAIVRVFSPRASCC